MSLSQRRHPRVTFRVPVEYGGFELFHPDWSLNLSVNGLFVLTTKPPTIGEKITLHFEIPDLRVPVEAVGHVVWTPGPGSGGAGKRHPQGMAVVFDWIDPKLRSVLDQYVTVTLGLSSVDTRIGKELHPHVRKELPVPDESSDEVLTNLVTSEEFLL